VNKHLYLCHPLVLSSPTLMMHGHMNVEFLWLCSCTRFVWKLWRKLLFDGFFLLFTSTAMLRHKFCLPHHCVPLIYLQLIHGYCDEENVAVLI